MTEVFLLEEIAGDNRLGRHVEHDPASRDYPADAQAPIKSVLWARHSPILNQGDLGSCCGNAAAGWLACDREGVPGRTDITEDTAVQIYSRATHLDRLPGVFPPTDSGSSGLGVAKAMRALGFTTGAYRHAFGVTHALAALQLGPVLVGMTWLAGCDKPDSSGLIFYEGNARGGHEVLLRGYDATTGILHFDQSWGPSWGAAGSFFMSREDFGRVLADQGDVTVPS